MSSEARQIASAASERGFAWGSSSAALYFRWLLEKLLPCLRSKLLF